MTLLCISQSSNQHPVHLILHRITFRRLAFKGPSAVFILACQLSSSLLHPTSTIFLHIYSWLPRSLAANPPPDEEQPILSSAKASCKRPSKTVTTRRDSGIECSSVGDEEEVLLIQSKSLIEKRTMSGVLEDYEDFEDDGDTDDEEAQLTSSKKPIQRRNTDKRHAKDDG
ncbi:hypothetical protein AMECASPLE_018870, partial [Ameca splendens]